MSTAIVIGKQPSEAVQRFLGIDGEIAERKRESVSLSAHSSHIAALAESAVTELQDVLFEIAAIRFEASQRSLF